MVLAATTPSTSGYAVGTQGWGSPGLGSTLPGNCTASTNPGSATWDRTPSAR
jgi:hypothetical protein